MDEVRPIQVPKGGTMTRIQSANDVASIWDTIYGPGFYVSHVLGATLYARVVATGNRGTVLNVEMYEPYFEPAGRPENAIKGVAKDNKDNIYKLVLL
jgi:hypothetical protein